MESFRFRSPALLYITVFLSAGWLLVGCSGNKTGEESSGVREIRSFPVIGLEQINVDSEHKYASTIEGIENIGIRAKVDGYIQAIYVDEGELVKKGQSLFRLETQSLSQSAKAAQSSIQVAEAGVNVAQVEVNRLMPLVEKGIISEVQLETAKANLASAKSRLAEAESQYHSIRENIGYTHITSPVTGVIGRIPYRQGTLVGRSEAEPLTTVSNINEVYIYFAMNEKDFLNFTSTVEGETLQEKIAKMPPVEFIMANGRRYSHPGKIQTITGQIDPRTGTVSFRAIFPNPELLLRSGGSGMITIGTTYENALVVPLQSSYEMQGEKFVYKLTENDTVRSQRLSFYDVIDNLILVSDGVKTGDRIVAEGVGNVRDGDVIQPENKSFSQYLDNIVPLFR